MLLKSFWLVARWVCLVPPCVSLVVGGCGSTYDDCHASKTCAPSGTGGTSGQASGGSGHGAAGESGRGAGESGEGGIANGAGGRAGSGAQDGSLSAGQAGEAGVGGAGEAGGASGSGGAGEMGGEGGSDAEPLPDTTPPHVVEVSPPDGATGVRADADIVVTFNEPMHRVETEKAYSSLDLPTKKVTFSWSNGDRTLTIHADDGLEYGSFSSGNATNHQQIYSYVIAEAARDVAGNRLEPEFAASFTMLREHWEMLSRVSVTRVLSPPPSTGLPECMAGEIVPIGELTPSQGKGLLVTFSTAAADWVEASSDLFRADLSVGIQPEATTLGPVHVDHVRVDPAAATWTTAVLDEPPLTHAPPTWTADTRDGLLADLTERSDGLTQFFIHHELATNTSAPVESSQVACSSITLKVSRLAL